MSNILSSVNQTTVATLETVTKSATAVTKTIDSGLAGIDMLHHFVSNARKKQIITTELDSENYVENLLNGLSEKQAIINKELADKLNSDPELKKEFLEQKQKLKLRYEELKLKLD